MLSRGRGTRGGLVAPDRPGGVSGAPRRAGAANRWWFSLACARNFANAASPGDDRKVVRMSITAAVLAFGEMLFDASFGYLVGKAADSALALREQRAARQAFAAAYREALAAVRQRHPVVAADYFGEEDLVGRGATEIGKFWTLDRYPDPAVLVGVDETTPPAEGAPLVEAATFFIAELDDRLCAAPALASHFTHRIVRDVRHYLRERPGPATVALAAQVVPPPLPAARTLHGRAVELAALVAALATVERSAVLLHGPPGIGKTALSIAALHHELVAAACPRRRFVALQAVPSGPGLLAACGAALGLAPGPDLAARTLAELATAPTLLVLDNLETPWEHDGAGTTEALDQLAAIAPVRLLASVRGTERPGRLAWRVLDELAPLCADAARALFLEVAGAAHAADPGLDRLLAAIDHVPLAIELLARRLDDAGGATRLLALWRERRTDLARAAAGDDKSLDLAASIELSVRSPRLPEAGRRLFALLGRLPAGIAEPDLEALLGADAFEAASGLRHVGLARRAGPRLVMLAPVRAHALGHEPADGDLAKLVAHYLDLAAALPQAGQPPDDPARYERARDELANIDAMIEVLSAQAPREMARFPAVLSLQVADTQRLLGGLALAMPGYERTHVILSRLAGEAPDDLDRQRDLSVSHDRIGDVRQAEGDLAGALEAYAAGRAIRERLAAADPRNSEWQRDLIVSNVKLAQIAASAGEPGEARRRYTAALAIARDLAATGRLAPADAWIPADLERRLAELEGSTTE